jgi:hypothetical protein
VASYQILILESASTAFTAAMADAIRSEVARAVEALGLDDDDVKFLDASSMGALDIGLPAAAVYLSDTANPQLSPPLATALERGLLVLPVVDQLIRFATLVPAALRPINGLEPRVAGDLGVAVTVTNRLFEELRLLRRTRRAFISYRRTESTGVAEQLHEALERRRYEVFLDTFGVDYGVDFQSVLWDTMARTDVAILLSTRTAFESAWVEQEVTRANLAGLAVLQLMWPHVLQRPPGTELAEVRYLQEADFEGTYSDTAKLTTPVLAGAVSAAEGLRARAQAARRRRVIEELRGAANRYGITMAPEQDGVTQRLSAKRAPMSFLWWTRPWLGMRKSERVYPLVGPPDAVALHEHWNLAGTAESSVIVYDALGILATRADHLGWLDKHLPQKAVSLQELDAWLKRELA